MVVRLRETNISMYLLYVRMYVLRTRTSFSLYVFHHKVLQGYALLTLGVPLIAPINYSMVSVYVRVYVLL